MYFAPKPLVDDVANGFLTINISDIENNFMNKNIIFMAPDFPAAKINTTKNDYENFRFTARAVYDHSNNPCPG